MLKSLKIETRLALGFGAILMLLASAIGLALQDITLIKAELEDIVSQNNVKTKLINEMAESVHVVSRAMRTIVFVNNYPAAVAEKKAMIEEARQRFDAAFTGLLEYPAGDHGDAIHARIEAAKQAARPL